MNSGIATTSAKATALEQQNAKLRNQIAPLSSSERIQREAVKRGYSLPAAGDVDFITGSVNANAKKAAQRLTAPGMGTGTASRTAAELESESSPSPVTPSPVTPSPVAAPPATTIAPPTTPGP
jgi:hypothetical protein